MDGNNFDKTSKWQELEGFYGISTRRLKPHARAGRIIGVTYRDGTYHFWGDPDMPYTMTGPIADIRQEFLLPPGTIALDREIMPGEVQGRIYEIDLQLEPDRKKPIIALMAEPACSGVIVDITPLASGMNPIISQGFKG